MNNRNMVNLNFSLLLFIALHFLLYSIHKSSAIQTENPRESNHFHIVEVSSLLTASSCNPSPTVSSKEGFLKLAHKYGPCSPIEHDKTSTPSEHKILERDQTKLMFRKSRLHGKTRIQVKWYDNSANLYVVKVGLGTPNRELILQMDTGSSLLWTQCLPCKLGNLTGCLKQKHSAFDPSKSSTYTNVKCPTQTCNLANYTLGSLTCASLKCQYTAAYLDGSETAGFLAKERVTVGSNSFNNIIIGCSHANINMDVGGADGIIGLGQDFLSFVEQTTKTYHKVFSYCLPSKASEVGFLNFGKAKRISKSLKFTRLGADYAIDLVGIKLGNTRLPITFKKGAASIDSGSSISGLPPKDYITLRDAYRKVMSHYHLVKQSKDEDLDTCYHIGGHQKLRIPKMSFLFMHGLVLDLPPYGIALPRNSTIFCLPFSPIPDGSDSVLLGAAQQKSLEIVYDLAKGKIGFGYDGCK